MSCFGDCLDLGPPPDSILFMPPPPLPSFLQRSVLYMVSGEVPGLGNESAPPCAVALMCDFTIARDGQLPGVEYVELPRQGPTGIDDTWLLVLLSSCVGVLLLGALLALFLLKCREAYTIHYSDSSVTKPTPGLSGLNSLSGLSPMSNNHHAPPLQNKIRIPLDSGCPLPAEPVIYSPAITSPVITTPPTDSRVLWAALTPRGTQHFISENYPQDFTEDHHYETIENYQQIDTAIRENASFDNSGFVDYDYEDPAPLIEAHQMENIESPYQNAEQKPFLVIGSLGRGGQPRPLVSSPTRIENPNLPPLNRYPHIHITNTLRKTPLGRADQSTLSRYQSA